MGAGRVLTNIVASFLLVFLFLLLSISFGNFTVLSFGIGLLLAAGSILFIILLSNVNITINGGNNTSNSDSQGGHHGTVIKSLPFLFLLGSPAMGGWFHILSTVFISLSSIAMLGMFVKLLTHRMLLIES